MSSVRLPTPAACSAAKFLASAARSRLKYSDLKYARQNSLSDISSGTLVSWAALTAGYMRKMACMFSLVTFIFTSPSTSVVCTSAMSAVACPRRLAALLPSMASSSSSLSAQKSSSARIEPPTRSRYERARRESAARSSCRRFSRLGASRPCPCPGARDCACDCEDWLVPPRPAAPRTDASDSSLAFL